MAARRKPKAAPEPDIVDHENEQEPPPPSLLTETVDGLLSLRGHLESRVPGGLLWPLQKLPSMDQHMSNFASAGDAVDSLAVRHAMSSSKLAELQEFLIGDAYAFTYLICRHRELVPEVHMPMCYASAGQAQKLAWFLMRSGFEGYIVDQYREEIRFRGIDLGAPGAIAALDIALNWVNFRDPRGVFKSSVISHGGLAIEATADPNTTAFIWCAKDDKAFELVSQVGETVTSGIFRDLFPHRVPAAARDTSKERIRMGGRTISHRQTTIQGSGYKSKEIGGHGDRFRLDDLVVRGAGGNDSPESLGGVRKHLSGMQGYHMLTRRVRTIHTGTMAVEGDDYHWLTERTRRKLCMTFYHPIETHDKPPATIFVRGTPTMPTFLSTERITEIQAGVVTSEQEIEGVEDWLCDYMLVPAARGGALFEDGVINDSDRTWMGPYKHPDARLLQREPHRFLVAKVKRDVDGAPVDQKKLKLDITQDGWRSNAAVESYDPWSDMDRIVTINTTWASGAKQWAIVACAVDSDLVRYQLEARAGDGGLEEWATVLRDIDKLYKPRVIGMDRKAFSDSIVQNALKTDGRLRGLHGRVVPVDQSDASEESRIRAGVAEPLKAHRILLLAQSSDVAHDYGASITRKEMLAFRAGSERVWPILDSLAMTSALIRAVTSREDRAKMDERRKRADAAYVQSVNPYVGVPSAA